MNMETNNITTMYIELTDKCQGSCPMCHRNIQGGIDAPHITNTEITLEQFKTWFDGKFLKQLQEIRFGDIGDPMMCSDVLEIVKYIKQENPDCKLNIYTNGGIRTVGYWGMLAQSLSNIDTVIFAIDGFKNTFNIYKIGVDYDKVIENAKSFISHGGNAKADILVFDHNEHQIDDLVSYCKELGFNTVNIKSTDRFHGLKEFPVHNKYGQIIYYIKPANKEGYTLQNVNSRGDYQHILTKLNTALANTTIVPKCNQSIYVTSQGHVYPCSWVGTIYPDYINNWKRSVEETEIRKLFAESGERIKSLIDLIELSNQDILTELENSNWKSKLPTCWENDKELMCAKNCGSNFMKLLQ